MLDEKIQFPKLFFSGYFQRGEKFTVIMRKDLYQLKAPLKILISVWLSISIKSILQTLQEGHHQMLQNWSPNKGSMKMISSEWWEKLIQMVFLAKCDSYCEKSDIQVDIQPSISTLKMLLQISKEMTFHGHWAYYIHRHGW